MNLILLFQSDFTSANEVQLFGRRHQHIASTLKSSVGDTVRVGVLNDRIGTGHIETIDTEQVTMSIQLHSRAPAPLPMTLVLSLPRPKMLKRCIRMAAEMGIKKLHIINSYKVEKSYWQSPLLSDKSEQPGLESKIDDYLCLGLEQSGDTQLPWVSLHRQFKPFVEDLLPELIGDRPAAVAHPYTRVSAPKKSVSDPSPSVATSNTSVATPNTSVATPNTKIVRPYKTVTTNESGLEPARTIDNHSSQTHPDLICIGPEGGYTDYEFNKLVEAGCGAIDLGQRIYRVETVLPLLVGRLFQQ